MADRGPYSRLYWSIQDDPRFAEILPDDRVFGAWVRLLIAADAAYPFRLSMPRMTPAMQKLIDAGLLLAVDGGTYTIRGLTGEREMRSQSGRNAAAVRWQSGRNADLMPRRDETRQDEKRREGSNARASNGAPPTPAPRPIEPGVWGGSSTHDGKHGPTCLVCHPIAKEGEAP